MHFLFTLNFLLGHVQILLIHNDPPVQYCRHVLMKLQRGSQFSPIFTKFFFIIFTNRFIKIMKIKNNFTNKAKIYLLINNYYWL